MLNTFALLLLALAPQADADRKELPLHLRLPIGIKIVELRQYFANF